MILVKTLRVCGAIAHLIALVVLACHMDLLCDNKAQASTWAVIWLALIFNFVANVRDTGRVLEDDIKP